MLNDTETVVVIIAATVGFIGLISCIGCMYCWYLKLVKGPAVQPVPEKRPENGSRHGEKHYGENEVENDRNYIETDKKDGDLNVKENGTLLPQTLLHLKHGGIIKPQVCISQETLSMYREMCGKNTQAMLAPPRKTPLLYEDQNMKKFHKEQRQAFEFLDLRETRKKIMTRRSRVSISSTLTDCNIMPLEVGVYRKELSPEQDQRIFEGSRSMETDISSNNTVQTTDTYQSHDNDSIVDVESDEGSSVEPVNESVVETTDESVEEQTEDAFVEPTCESVLKPSIDFVEEPASVDQERPLTSQSGAPQVHFVNLGDVDIGSIMIA